MTDLVEDAAASLPAAMLWTPPALSEAKIAEIRALAAKADQLVEASLSENTRIAYGKVWRAWSEWCLGFGLDPTGADPAAAADARWLVIRSNLTDPETGSSLARQVRPFYGSSRAPRLLGSGLSRL